MSRPKLVIFDCDGTLVDSQALILSAMGTAFREHDLEPPERERILGIVGLSIGEAIFSLHPTGDPELLLQLVERYKTAFRDLRSDPRNTEPLFDGMRGLLDQLHALDDTLLGLATGKSRRGVDALCEREGLDRHFQTVQTADTNLSKPHPEMLLTALNETGVAPEDALMIGDTTFDLEMAAAAEIKAIAVTWGYHPAGDLADRDPWALCDTSADLERVVFGWLSDRRGASRPK